MSEVTKFPVFKSVGEVFSGVTRHYFDLIKAAPIAIVIFAAANVFMTYLSDSPWALEMSLKKRAETAAEIIPFLPFMASTIFAFVFYYVAVVMAAVRWHRFVLIGDRNAPVWSRYDGRYMWTNIKMMLAMIGMILVSSIFFSAAQRIYNDQTGLPLALKVIGGAGLALIFLMLLMWVVRVSLAFPDAALGGSGKIGNALWRTTGYSWRLLGYFMLILLPLAFAAMIAGKAMEKIIVPAIAPRVTDVAGYEAVAAEALLLPLSIYVLMAQVTMLSVAYREIIGLPQSEA